MDTYQEVWDNYYVHYYAKNGSLNDVQHAIMMYTTDFITQLATALWELNGDTSLTIDHFRFLAWEGLDYIHPNYQQSQMWLYNSHYLDLHNELLLSNPQLILGCNN